MFPVVCPPGPPTCRIESNLSPSPLHRRLQTKRFTIEEFDAAATRLFLGLVGKLSTRGSYMNVIPESTMRKPDCVLIVFGTASVFPAHKCLSTCFFFKRHRRSLTFKPCFSHGLPLLLPLAAPAPTPAPAPPPSSSRLLLLIIIIFLLFLIPFLASPPSSLPPPPLPLSS